MPILVLISLLSLSSPASAVKKEKEVSIAIESAIRTFDPRFTSDANSQYLEDLLHCSLIEFGPEAQTRPQLAAEMPSWLAPDKLQVKIRSGVKFSDGSPVTAADVVATYMFFKQPDQSAPRSGSFKNVSSVTSQAPNTVVFQLSEPDASFLQNLIVGILPARLAGTKDVLPSEKVMGCGAFKVVSNSTLDTVLEPNPQYALGEAPKLNRITIKVVKKEKTQLNKLIKGELDIVQNSVNRDALATIKKRHRHLQVMHKPGLKTTYLGFNMKDPDLSKVEVRQAINLAIEREPIIRVVLAGMATPAATLLPPGSAYFNSELKVQSVAIDQAKALLDKAGYPEKDGKPRLELTYKTTNNETRIQIASAIASQLKKIGVAVKVVPLEWGKFKDDVEKGQIQLWGLTWIGFKDPDIYRYVFSSEFFPPNGGNRGWFKDDGLDRLLTEAQKEIHEPNRQKLYFRIQELVAQKLPYVFLWHDDNYAVLNKRIKGYELYADGRWSSLKTADVKQ